MKWQLVFLLLMGFSLGDELGFKQSLSNTEVANRRSATSARSAAGYFAPLLTTTAKPGAQKNDATIANNRSSHAINLRSPGARHAVSMTVPPFRPIHPGENKLNRPTRITKVREEDPITVVAVPAFAALPQSIAKVPTYSNKAMDVQGLQTLLTTNNNNHNDDVNNRRVSYNSLLGQKDSEVSNLITQLRVVPAPASDTAAPSDPLLPEAVGNALKSVAQATNISADALLASIQLRQQQVLYQQQKQLAALAAAATSSPTASPEASTTSRSSTPVPTTLSPSTSAPASGFKLNSQTANPLSDVSMDSSDFEFAPPASAPSPAKPVTKAPLTKPKYQLTGVNKVMNAPKEYYPVNYDKNFDDNFTSRVGLPDTSFSCGDQKHFPGLYADEDLNCMVFHVCALTDDGLVMKSFLCPESTLFDQTILKCNWWFYVDCKASKKLYDSNIPISKSYQLMKALTFFSSYNKSEKSSS